MFAGWMPHAEEVLSAAKPWRAGGEYPRYPMAAARRCPERSGHPLPAIEARPPSDQRERPRQKVAVPPARPEARSSTRLADVPARRSRRNDEAPDARFAELEADQAQVDAAVVQVKLGSRGHQGSSCDAEHS